MEGRKVGGGGIHAGREGWERCEGTVTRAGRREREGETGEGVGGRRQVCRKNRVQRICQLHLLPTAVAECCILLPRLSLPGAQCTPSPPTRCKHSLLYFTTCVFRWTCTCLFECASSPPLSSPPLSSPLLSSHPLPSPPLQGHVSRQW